MRKLIVLLAIGCGLVHGQPACTQITQTIYQNGGARPVPMNGSITLSTGYTAQDGAFVIAQSEAPIPVVNGRLSTCQPAASYEADYTVNPIAPLSNTVQFTRYWTVPATGGPYKLTDIPAGAVGPIEGQVFASPAPQTYAVGATGATGPQGASGTGNAPYSAVVTSLTTLTVPAATHGQGVTPRGFCSDTSSVPIDCKAVPDTFGNMTFTWPGGFTGSVMILGGGSGPRGPTGATGAQGIQGALGIPTPPASGVYCVQVANGQVVFVAGICGSVSALYLSTLTDAALFNLTDFQLALLTNGAIVPLSLSSLTNSQLTALANIQLANLTN